MSFMNSIIGWLTFARDNLLIAYKATYSWVYPFNLISTPLNHLYMAFKMLTSFFGDFNTWLVYVAGKVTEILNIGTIVSYFQTWIDAANSAWAWIGSAVSNITNIINTWWSSTQSIVKVWIEQSKQWMLAQINNLAYALTEVQTWWNSFKSSIPSLNEILLWFTNWWTNVLSHLQTWWVERLSDIQSLLISLALDLAPFWAGWQEIREIVFDFFDNPLEWLWSKFTDWFLGAE